MSEYKTPTLEIDLSKVSKKFSEIQKALSNFKVFYAVKANPDQEVLKILKRAGSSFEIASIGELDRLVKIGVKPKDVIFSNPVKIPEHVELAHKAGVRYFAFDSKEELDKIADLAPKSNVYLRLNVSNVGSKIELSTKFGCTKEEAVNLILYAKELKLDPCGIAFHVGSQAEKVKVWERAIDDVSTLMGQLSKYGIRLKVLNIGGGFPVDYGSSIPGLNDIAKNIEYSIKKLPYSVGLWCEPGRFLVAEAGTIYARIIGKTMRSGESWLFLDTGRFQSFIELFESEDIRYPVMHTYGNVKNQGYTLTGPTCDSYDTIMHNVMLPVDIAVGDTLSFGMCGAYTYVYGAPFNDFPVPEITYARN